MKPVAESCLRNQDAIYQCLRTYMGGQALSVFEIGSGTGQHAVYIADRLPNLIWQPSDLAECLPGVEAWRVEARQANVLAPIALDANQSELAEAKYDVVFTANTIHFVSEQTGRNIVRQAAALLKPGGHFFVYGPFKNKDVFTSEGDKRLQEWLQTRDPESGIRDRQWVIQNAESQGLKYQARHEMPANNFILVFTKKEA